VLWGLGAGLSGPARAAGRVFAIEPPDGAVSDANPVFQLGFEDIAPAEVRRARFRITLSTDGFRSAAYVFDQRELRAGWLPGEPGRVYFRPRSPLADGDYEWKAAVWNGWTWDEDPAARRLRIDTVPPADVVGLRLERDARSGSLRLSWDPVVLDRDGRAEFVARYNVYRYLQGPPYPVLPALRVASGPELSWTDDEDTNRAPLVMYRVTAEDEAGNEALRR